MTREARRAQDLRDNVSAELNRSATRPSGRARPAVSRASLIRGSALVPASARSAPSFRATPAKARRRPISSRACSPRDAVPAARKSRRLPAVPPAVSTRRTSATWVAQPRQAPRRHRPWSRRVPAPASAGLVGVEPGFPQPRAELFGVGGVDRGNPGRDACDLRLDGVASLDQHGDELRAFAGARAASSASASSDQPAAPARQARPGQRWARPARRASAGSRPPTAAWRPGAPCATSAAAFASCLDPREIDGKACGIGRRPRQRDAAFDLAALQLAENLLPQRGFEPAQFVRQADLEVEKAVVDGAQLDRQRSAGQFRGQLPRSPSC